ncbi:MAG TPA: choice-of-anchor D domain-containing protein [Terracidiphilus sp.]|nr:choice-of-anchor D domain-containing protein [Terracidiphilus sp.]
MPVIFTQIPSSATLKENNLSRRHHLPQRNDHVASWLKRGLRRHLRLANLSLLLTFCLGRVAFSAVTAGSTISYIQGNYATPQSSQSTVSVKYSSAQSASDLNVVVVGWNDSKATVKTVVDSAGNTYSRAIGPTVVSGMLSQSVYFAKNIASASAGNTVTVTFSTAAVSPDIRILEYSGADPTNPVDVAAAKTGTTSPTSATVTTVNPTDLLLAANIVRTSTTGPGSGFTKRLLTQPDGDIVEDAMAQVAGSYTASASISASGSWIMQIVALRTPSGGNPVAVTPATLSCSSSSMTGTGTDACTVTLSAAPSSTLTVNLASNDSAVAVPAAVTVPAGATSTSFTATVSAVSTSQTATLTASAGNVVKTFTLQLNAAVPNLAVSSSSLSFGSVNVNTATTQSIKLSSTGTAAVTINSATVSGSGFSISGATFPLTLNPNQTATLSVQFAPTASGTVSGSLTLASNSSTGSSSVVSLTGNGMPVLTGLSCSPANLSAGSASTCTVTFNQTAPAGGSSITLSSSSIALTVPASVTVAAGSSTATFAATAGTFNTNQSVTVNASFNGTTVSATVNLVLPTSIAYVQGNYVTPQSASSNVGVTYNAAQQAGDLNVVVVGWNDSTAVVSKISDSLGNTYSLVAGPTVVSGLLSQSVYYAKNIKAAAAATNTVTVTFSKAATSADVRIVEYSGADPVNPVDVAASGSGSSTSTTVSAKTTNPSDLIFGANIVRTLTTGAGSSFTKRLLTQPDGDIVEDQMVQTAGSYTATASLNASGSWIMQMVAFRTPTGSNPVQATLSALSCTNASMTGAGTDACTVTLNGAASSSLTVNLASTSSAVAVPASVTVAAGAASANFSATIASVSSAQAVTLSASAGTMSQTFALQLNAAVATLSVNATSIAFGDVSVNTPTTQTVTLTSTGAMPVTVNSATISGTGFTVSGVAFPLTLNPNQAATLSVQFYPTTAGSSTGQLTISSNSSTNSTAIVALSGTGEATYQVAISWAAPANSADPVAGYNVYRSPTGSSSYQLVTSVGSSQLTYSDTEVQTGQAYSYIVQSVDASGNESAPSNVASVTIP